jgi:hypothetical protein
MINARLTSVDLVAELASLRLRWPLTNFATRAENGLHLLRAVAALHSGRFHGDQYGRSRQSHSFTCSAGHEFQMVVLNVIRGCWCPACGLDQRRLGIAAAQAFALERGGECLSSRYRAARGTLRWRCSAGHEWRAPFRTLRDNNEWCHACRANQMDGRGRQVLARLDEMAADRGGEVVSRQYLGTRVKLRFRCSLAHEWDAPPDSVLKKGTWCRQCSMNWLPPSEQLAALRRVVAGQDGELLSTEYVNRKTKVQVRCKQGHVWGVQPAKLHQGRWCPTCHYDRLRTYRTQKRADSAARRSKGVGPILP